MPNIKPISYLRHYKETFGEVKEKKLIYLIRDSNGEYNILNVNELEKIKATIKLLTELHKGEKSSREKGWLSPNEVGILDMPEIIFSPFALEDIQSICNNPFSSLGESESEKVYKKVVSDIRKLKLHPLSDASLGKIMDITVDYRYFFSQNNYIFYYFSFDRIHIVRILNGEQDYLQKLFGVDIKS